MSDLTPRPLADTSVEPDPDRDPAQAEWDRTTALEQGAPVGESESATATGDDPAHISSDEDQIPTADLPSSVEQPESQGEDPLIVELGEDGEGDLAPEDL